MILQLCGPETFNQRLLSRRHRNISSWRHGGFMFAQNISLSSIQISYNLSTFHPSNSTTALPVKKAVDCSQRIYHKTAFKSIKLAKKEGELWVEMDIFSGAARRTMRTQAWASLKRWRLFVIRGPHVTAAQPMAARFWARRACHQIVWLEREPSTGMFLSVAARDGESSVRISWSLVVLYKCKARNKQRPR